MPIPHGISLQDAAGLPEVACTVWSNLVLTAHLHEGQLLLMHGGASGIGTHAIQVARALGARVAVTAGSAAKLDVCRDLGAEITINYHDEDFVASVYGVSAASIFLGEPLHRHTLLAMVAAVVGLALSVAGSLQASALAGMAVASIVVLCMSCNYVVVRHRRDIGMTPAIWLASVIAALVTLPFSHPGAVMWSQVPWLLVLGPGQLAGGLLLYMASRSQMMSEKILPALKAGQVVLRYAKQLLPTYNIFDELRHFAPGPGNGVT